MGWLPQIGSLPNLNGSGEAITVPLGPSDRTMLLHSLYPRQIRAQTGLWCFILCIRVRSELLSLVCH